MILTTAFQKGGVGKTTTAAAISQAAVFRGFKTLAIDLDPQGSLSFMFAANTGGNGSYGLLQGEPAADLIQSTACGVDIIPAAWALSTITSGKGSARRLQTGLQPIKKEYDLIVLDAPTMAGELQFNALQASDALVMPLQADSMSLQGLYQTVDTAKQFQRSNPELRIHGFIFTEHSTRSNIAKKMQQAITEQAEEMGVPCLGVIRTAAAIREATAFQESLFEYAPRSNPAIDYLAVFDKLGIKSSGRRKETKP